MGAKADIQRRILKGKKGKATQTVVDESFQLDTTLLLGDGLAEVGRNRSVKFGVGYGDFSISGSCYVKLHCNQDTQTILDAANVAQEIADHVMRRDQTMMRKVAARVAEELDGS